MRLHPASEFDIPGDRRSEERADLLQKAGRYGSPAHTGHAGGKAAAIDIVEGGYVAPIDAPRRAVKEDIPQFASKPSRTLAAARFAYQKIVNLVGGHSFQARIVEASHGWELADSHLDQP